MGHGHVLSEKRIAPTERKVKAALVKAGKRQVTAYEVEAYLMASGGFCRQRGVRVAKVSICIFVVFI